MAPDGVPERIAAMQAEIKKLRKGAPAGEAALSATYTVDSPEGKVIIATSETADPQIIRGLCDQQRQKGAAAIFVAAAAEKKVTLIAMVSDALIASAGLKAGDWVKAVAPVVGGGGGGKPTLAQAGGKQPEKLPDALAAAHEWAKERLS